MKFEVAYRGPDGRMTESVIEVSDRNAVYTELRRQGIVPLSLREVGARRKRAGGKNGAFAYCCSTLLLVLALAALGFAVWYAFVADDGARLRLRSRVRIPSKIDFTVRRPAEAPHRGTGKASVKISAPDGR